MAAAGSLVHLTVANEEGTLALLKHVNNAVRVKAVKTLGMSTLGGNDRAIAAVCGSLEDKDAEVRRAAVRALQHLVYSGDQDAIQKLAGRLDDTDASVRRAAVIAVKNVAGRRGDMGTLDVVLKQLKVPRPAGRAAAMECLGRVGERGDAFVVDAAERLLHLDTPLMQQAAMDAFVQLASVAHASSRLETSERAVQRLASIRALMQIAREGNSDAVIVAMNYLEDNDDEVTKVATVIIEEAEARLRGDKTQMMTSVSEEGMQDDGAMFMTEVGGIESPERAASPEFA